MISSTLQNYLSGISIRQIDGVILCFINEDETIDRIIEDIQADIPIVLMGWDISDTRFNSVVIDLCEGVYSATMHLIAMGHKKIAYIGGPKDNKIFKEKFGGYSKAFRKSGYEIDDDLILYQGHTLQSGYQGARKLLAQGNLPTAIVAANDILAIGAIKYFLQHQINIPDQMAVIGFDNIPLSLMYEPALSTVALPMQQIGREGIHLLLTRINNPTSRNKQIILNTSLIIRNSTDKNAPTEFDL